MNPTSNESHTMRARNGIQKEIDKDPMSQRWKRKGNTSIDVFYGRKQSPGNGLYIHTNVTMQRVPPSIFKTQILESSRPGVAYPKSQCLGRHQQTYRQKRQLHAKMNLALDNPSLKASHKPNTHKRLSERHDVVSRPGHFNGLAGILEPLEAGVQGLYRTTR